VRNSSPKSSVLTTDAEEVNRQRQGTQRQHLQEHKKSKMVTREEITILVLLCIFIMPFIFVGRQLLYEWRLEEKEKADKAEKKE
jgi:cell division protein FtsB